MDNTLGFDLITLSWPNSGAESGKAEARISQQGSALTENQATEFLQDKFLHQPRRLPTVPTPQPHETIDVMIDGSLKRCFPVFPRKTM